MFLATPTSTLTRLEKIARESSGFLYLVSRTGVTGDASPAGSIDNLVASLRMITPLPLAGGFGISTPEQAAAAGAAADAVVVGSAFMRTIESSTGERLEQELETLARGFASALRSPAGNSRAGISARC